MLIVYYLINICGIQHQDDVILKSLQTKYYLGLNKKCH